MSEKRYICFETASGKKIEKSRLAVVYLPGIAMDEVPDREAGSGGLPITRGPFFLPRALPA
jgi:hypothetical protein